MARKPPGFIGNGNVPSKPPYRKIATNSEKQTMNSGPKNNAIKPATKGKPAPKSIGVGVQGRGGGLRGRGNKT